VSNKKLHIKIEKVSSVSCAYNLVLRDLNPGVYLIFRYQGEPISYILNLDYESELEISESIAFIFDSKSFYVQFSEDHEINKWKKIDVSESPINEELVQNIHSEVIAGHLTEISYLSMLSRLLVTNLIRYFNGVNEESDNGLSMVHLETIQKFIDQNMSRPISLGELAEQIQMTPNKFSKLFRTSFGGSPYNYLNGIKMQQARAMLEEKKDSIIQVGIQVGFENPSHFSRVFKKYYGMSPRSYTKQVLQKDIND